MQLLTSVVRCRTLVAGCRTFPRAVLYSDSKHLQLEQMRACAAEARTSLHALHCSVGCSRCHAYTLDAGDGGSKGARGASVSVMCVSQAFRAHPAAYMREAQNFYRLVDHW